MLGVALRTDEFGPDASEGEVGHRTKVRSVISVVFKSVCS